MSSMSREEFLDISGVGQIAIVHRKDGVAIGWPMAGVVVLSVDQARSLACKLAAVRADEGLSHEELVVACRNIGFDLSCAKCASVFYTGSGTYPHDAGCKTVSSSWQR
jgi:hypothetical protein